MSRRKEGQLRQVFTTCQLHACLARAVTFLDRRAPHLQAGSLPRVTQLAGTGEGSDRLATAWNLAAAIRRKLYDHKARDVT